MQQSVTCVTTLLASRPQHSHGLQHSEFLSWAIASHHLVKKLLILEQVPNPELLMPPVSLQIGLTVPQELMFRVILL